MRINGVAVQAKKWSRMPGQGRYPPVPIRVNGVRSEAQLTEGGAPLMKYSYFRVAGQVYYVKGHIAHDSEVAA
jgi:hypothetical protein